MTARFRLIAHTSSGEQVFTFEHPDHARQFGQLLETLGADWTLVGADGEEIAPQPEHVHDGDTFGAGVCCGAPHCKAAPHIEGCYATDPASRDDSPVLNGTYQ